MWKQPKTDWNKDDYFNAEDFNRIKNNLVYLRGLSVKLYKEFNISSVGIDKTYKDYFYADEINLLESNFETINQKTLNAAYGEKVIYKDNGNTMTYKELNRLENAIFDLYGKFMNQADGRRHFTFNLGTRGGL
ncbi:hypothetical protein [Criibacterium bergeronii]|uniref:Uncharacterized protein n=1 Tax=Criibacterium bergeronii TaxID=1871336 RepID=A0A1C0AG43_9FIRM|nr:hypothetical protein [Criibacterium bergeronii]RDY21447.1 hypothetical protein BBG48_004825 [Criibacterium bergeronii]